MSMFAQLTDAWKNRASLGDANRSRELAAFLPPSLEIQESPPNPMARKLAWSLLVLVLLAIAWASFGKVNIVASAEGKIVPSSRVKQVQPLEKGVVKEIFVNEGDYVEKGQALVELDTTLTEAEKNRLESELYSTNMRLIVDEALLSLLEKNTINIQFDDLASMVLNEKSKAQDLSLHHQLLWQQWLQYRSQLQSLQSGLEKTQAEKAATQEIVKKLKQTLPIVTKRSENLKDLNAKQFVSETEYLEVEQERIQQFQDLAAEKQKLKQLAAAENEVREQINLHTAQTRGALLMEVAELKRQITSMEEELNKAKDINAKQVLYASVAGRVQELSVNTIGGVVTAAQELMLIVPDEESLEVEVFLENKDIGFVREEMPAEIKIHTFPFTKYGIIDAQVTNVSDDAIVDEQRGLIYSMQLRMAENTIQVEGKTVKLLPGMAVTAEVQTGYRRIIEFFMAPLLRYKQESIRER